MGWKDAPVVKEAGWQSAPIVSKAKPAPKKSDSAIGGFVSGVLKPIDNLAEAASNIPYVGPAIDSFGQTLGMPSTKQAVGRNQAYRQNNTRTGYQTLGNIAGTAPTLALPGGALVQGGASGALLSDKKDALGIVTDAGIGAVTGKAGQMLANGAAYLAKPVVSKGAQMLADSGIPMTLGQIASQGKGFGAKLISGAEEKLTSVPLLGDLINSARDRGTQGFNIALGNRVLANVGEKMPKGVEPGNGMVEFVSKKLSDRYGKLVPNLTGNFDRQFVADLTKAKAVTSVLPTAKQKQFANIVQDVFQNRAKGATISGQALKDAESRLTMLTKQYSNSSDADQRIMADAIGQVRQGLRSMVARNNPEHAAELQALNKGWAQLGQLRKASTAAGNSSGVVTPAQALSASRKSGFDDQFVKYAKDILPNKTPDSGTATRAGYGLLATGGAAKVAAGVNPWLAAPAAGSILYTKAGQKALNSLVFAPRGKILSGAGTSLRQLGKAAPAAIPALLKQDR